ncbi:hypothetical protein Syun_004155 [Stephania yunnanensis]|uniref:Uncharacterized protein n=1 Tax=Stephania yunnanensis TaxID=152371 RepID=A0AAP0Q0X5_9MAGN
MQICKGSEAHTALLRANKRCRWFVKLLEVYEQCHRSFFPPSTPPPSPSSSSPIPPSWLPPPIQDTQ